MMQKQREQEKAVLQQKFDALEQERQELEDASSSEVY